MLLLSQATALKQRDLASGVQDTKLTSDTTMDGDRKCAPEAEDIGRKVQVEGGIGLRPLETLARV